jgi:hypothetical protein
MSYSDLSIIVDALVVAAIVLIYLLGRGRSTTTGRRFFARNK